MAISAPLKTQFSCAVPGGVFLQLLNTTSPETEVTMEVVESTFKVKAGRSTWKLSVQEPALFKKLFTMPDAPKNGLLAKREDLLAAIECCLMSVSDDTSIPDQLGITFFRGANLTLFSTNGTTMSRAVVPATSQMKAERACVSGAFCRELVRLSKQFRLDSLVIADDHTIAALEDVVLFGHLIDVPQPQPFNNIYKDHVPKGVELYKIPKRLAGILERAIVITDTNAEKTSTLVTIKKNGDGSCLATFFSEAESRGSVRDTLMIEQKDEVSLRLRAKPFKTGCDAFTHMTLTDKCAILNQGKHTLLVAGSEK